MLEKTLAALKGIPSGTFVPDNVVAFDEAELRELANVLNRLLYAPSQVRRYLQMNGVSIVPSNFYSEIPTIEEIERIEQMESPPTYCNKLFNNFRMLEFLGELILFSSEFDPRGRGDVAGPRYTWEDGGIFSFSDAVAYYSIVRKTKPRNILEIGSGYSTLIALEAMEKNGCGKITCIEPYPRDFLKDLHEIDLQQRQAQSIGADFINDTLSDGDILFIDSTHTVKHGSDCLHIYLNLIPNIRRDIYVHVHDVYLPHGLPLWALRDKQIYWTEQYLLGAYLMDNPKASVVYGSSFHYRHNRADLERFMHGRFQAGGASLWFYLNGNWQGS